MKFLHNQFQVPLNIDQNSNKPEMLHHQEFTMPISSLIAHHEQRLTKTINLVASENVHSEAVKRALSSDLAMRYCIPPADQRPAGEWERPKWLSSLSAWLSPFKTQNHL